jgi:hypothetical protein
LAKTVTYSRRKFLVIFVVVMAALIIDQSISNISDIITQEITSTSGVALFIAIATVYAVGQYYILEMVKAKNKEITIKSLHNNAAEKMITAVQYVLTAIIVFTVLQIIVSSQYHTNLLIAAFTISYGAASILMGILAWKLFSWFKINKRFEVLLFGLATAVITMYLIDNIILVDVILMGKPALITPESEVIYATMGLEPYDPMYIVLTLQNYSLTAFIILIWAGTVLLLRHNVRRIGKVKFSVIVTLPLIYFMSYYVTLYQQFYPTSVVTEAISSNFMIPILLYTYSYMACGVLFGAGFLSISRHIGHSNHVRDYMIITGFGLILFFSAGFATVLQAPYPPYGLPNVSFAALSCFLILVGLYQSAVSIAQDVNLRNWIRKSVIQSKLLDSIGTAQMEQELQNKVITMTKENAQVLEKESGIEPSLTDEEIQQYVDRVISEIKSDRDALQDR